MAFPDDPLDARVELRIGDTWTDITDDAYTRDPITITRGRPDEGARTDPSRCTLTLNNRDGAYSPRNPTSPHYGLIGRNTPARVAVHAGSPYLDLPGENADVATTPDHASLDITGDIDVRLDIALDDWGPDAFTELAAKNIFSTNQRSWFLALNTDGTLFWEWSTTGADVLQANSTEPVPAPPSGRAAVRVTLDADNGAGGRTVTFHTADTIAGPWTQLGDPVTQAGTTSIHAGTAPVEVAGPTTLGFASPVGKCFAFELRSGIDGTIVADPDFTAQAVGATSFTDSAGRTWTIGGNASLTNRRGRAEGEIPAWPPRWDVSGTDVWTPVEAAGILRRLGQGASALPSTLARRIPSHGPLAYWPLEEGADATRAYSPIPGVAPLKAANLRWAADDSLPGSAALPELGDADAALSGPVPAPATSNQWNIQFVYNLDGVTAPASGSTLLQWRTSGTAKRWRILYEAGLVTVQAYDEDGTLVVNQPIGVGDDIFTAWTRLEFSAAQNGGNVDWVIDWTLVGESAGIFDDTFAGTVGAVRHIDTSFSPALAGGRIGHLSVWDTADSALAYDFADHGFTGESAGDRIARVCDEEGVPVTVAAPADATTALGPQRPQALLDVLGEAADADGGILYERRDGPELRYRGRTTLYNQTPALTLDYAAGEVAPPLEPTDDDQALRNDITVSRTGGSSAPAVLEEGPLSVQDPPDGVGRYDESVAVTVESDDQLDGIAWWRLHLGTWDEARYPAVTVNLAAAPHLIDAAAAVDIGDRIALVNLPSWLPPGGADLIVQGYAETIAPYWWEITYTCTPAGPWNVATADDDVLGRADTDGSELAAAVDADDTTLPVAVTDGPLWTTDEGEFPFDARLGGEVVTVTAITGTTSPQNWIATRAVNGVVKAHAAGTAVRLAHPAALAL